MILTVLGDWEWVSNYILGDKIRESIVAKNIIKN